MIFCGQCGLQLAPGSTRCPRCGATIDEHNPATSMPPEELHNDDATIASSAVFNPPQAQPPNQPFILRPGASGSGGNYETGGPSTFNYDATSQYDPTNQMGQAGYPTSQQAQGNTYGNYPPQAGNGNYPPTGAYQSGGYPPQGAYLDYPADTGNYGSDMSYTNMSAQTGHQQAQYQQNDIAAQQNARGRTTGLVLVLVGLLLILTAVLLFAFQQGIIGSKTTALISGNGSSMMLLCLIPPLPIKRVAHRNKQK